MKIKEPVPQYPPRRRLYMHAQYCMVKITWAKAGNLTADTAEVAEVAEMENSAFSAFSAVRTQW